MMDNGSVELSKAGAPPTCSTETESTSSGQPQSDVNFEFTVGDVGLKLRGPIDWVEAQKAKAFPMLESAISGLGQSALNHRGSSGASISHVDDESLSLKPAVTKWLADNDISADDLATAFDVEAGYEIIVSDAPGKTIKEKLQNLYLLVGLSAFLRGSESFADQDARECCKRYGVDADSNHATYVKELQKGNLAGNKSDGYRLTMPGRKVAGKIVREACAAAIA